MGFNDLPDYSVNMSCATKLSSAVFSRSLRSMPRSSDCCDRFASTCHNQHTPVRRNNKFAASFSFLQRQQK